MFETDSSAGHCGSLPSRPDCPGQRSLSTVALECVGSAADHRLSARGRACADAQGRCDGDWLQRNRLINPPAHITCAGGLLAFLPPLQFNNKEQTLHFFGEVSRAEALGIKREDRPAAFAGRFRIGLSRLGYYCCLHDQVSYPSRQTLPHPDITSAGQEIRQLRVQLSSERRVQRAGPVTQCHTMRDSPSTPAVDFADLVRTVAPGKSGTLCF